MGKNLRIDQEALLVRPRQTESTRGRWLKISKWHLVGMEAVVRLSKEEGLAAFEMGSWIVIEFSVVIKTVSPSWEVALPGSMTVAFDCPLAARTSILAGPNKIDCYSDISSC